MKKDIKNLLIVKPIDFGLDIVDQLNSSVVFNRSTISEEIDEELYSRDKKNI
jgi:hypothetical protein